MHTCLITAPTVSDFDDPEITLDAYKPRSVQLGLLCVAASIRTHGHTASVIDLDQITLSTLTAGGRQVTPDDLFDAYVQAIASIDAPVYGFSTICGSYPATIRMAQELRRIRPDAQIVLGGPQASVVDIETMEAFPWIDLIIRGEADDTFPAYLDALEQARGTLEHEKLAGITYRDGARGVRGTSAPLVADLDALPLPAFDLDPCIVSRGSVHLELGRGCPYGCSFCSTNDFFRRKFRLKSSATLLTQMRELHERYGVAAFTLVHDMYTVDRKKVVEFAELLLASGEQFTWSCSARTDRVDRDLLDLMARAGCQGIFFGIESGSANLQKAIKKNLDLDKAWDSIRGATANGMKTAVALIIGFPEETRGDLRSSVHFFVESRRLENAEPQMSLLAPLADTPIEKLHRNELVFDHIYSDMSAQGWREDERDFQLIRSYPRIFPNFYSVPALLPRQYVREVRDFTQGITFWFRWLPIALLDATNDLLNVIDEFARWHDTAPKDDVSAGYSTRTPRYYCSSVFAHDVLSFVAEALEDGRLPDDWQLRRVLEYEQALSEFTWPDATPPSADVVRASMNDRLVRSPNAFVRNFSFDPAKVLGALRTGAKAHHCATRTTLAFTGARKESLRVLRLSEKASDLVALCDGEATVEKVLERFSNKSPGGVMGGLVGLKRLYEDGILECAS